MKVLIPYFELNGKSTYPDGYHLFGELVPVSFNGSEYYLTDYEGGLDLETGADTYQDYADAGMVVSDEPIMVTVTLQKNSMRLPKDGEVQVGYVINFNEPITSPKSVEVPISITDRNGMHVDNIGLFVPANTPKQQFSGVFTIDKRGDFTVTNEAINFHESTGMNIISRRLELTEQPWLRVFQ